MVYKELCLNKASLDGATKAAAAAVDIHVVSSVLFTVLRMDYDYFVIATDKLVKAAL